MLIVGAKGFAKEVLEILHQNKQVDDLAFYDDVNDIGESLFERFPILKTEKEVKSFFKENGNEFSIGIGNPQLRYKLYRKFSALGGKFTSTLSPLASIGYFGNIIGEGCNIMTNSVITSDVKIGKGVLINLNCTIGHDCEIGDFVELTPDVNISGNCSIGDFSFIGTNASVLPNIKVGENVVIGAGSVVTKDVPDNSVVYGVPAKVIKTLPPFDL